MYNISHTSRSAFNVFLLRPSLFFFISPSPFFACPLTLIPPFPPSLPHPPFLLTFPLSHLSSLSPSFPPGSFLPFSHSLLFIRLTFLLSPFTRFFHSFLFTFAISCSFSFAPSFFYRPLFPCVLIPLLFFHSHFLPFLHPFSSTFLFPFPPSLSSSLPPIPSSFPLSHPSFPTFSHPSLFFLHSSSFLFPPPFLTFTHSPIPSLHISLFPPIPVTPPFPFSAPIPSLATPFTTPTILPQNFTVVWRCRVAGEAWPADDTIPKPIWTKGTGGGCFGNGPGLLDHTETTLSLLGSDFMTHGQTYEFEAIVKKDTRSTVALGQVVVVDGVPPIMKVQCIDPSLCIPDGDGVYVNPSFRIGLISECVDYCDGDVSYLWAAADGNDVTFPADPAHFPLGATANELAFSTQFFNDNPNLQDLRISLDATDNSQPSTGGGAYFMKVNQRPVGGTCSVAKPPLERALIDTYTLTCQGWVDPENKGIKSYNVWLVDDTGKRIPLTEATWSPVVPQDISLIMPPGTFTVEVEVVDKWGAFTLVKPEIDMTVNMPTKEELEAADVDKLIADLSGGGNTDMLIMALAAQTEVLKQAEWLSLSEENLATMTDEEKEELLIYLAEKNNAALDALKENVNFNSLSNINAAASTLSGILKGASINQEAVKTIDLDAKEKIVGLTEDMMEGLEDIEVAVPELLIPLANYMSNIVGGLSLVRLLRARH
ncbi:hypothetical protein C7M84_003163 [Penaeus vannamei]|uniref:PKD/REJ-like domain-containing protein n=1 Tax=Penaeus vannamei TaxID=6689 RepID=A0A3R7SW50_PENVA|nr:hypothetical protein C7M84_003163 [Penaeus vannamei]